jgi:hypothetical protein
MDKLAILDRQLNYELKLKKLLVCPNDLKEIFSMFSKIRL